MTLNNMKNARLLVPAILLFAMLFINNSGIGQVKILPTKLKVTVIDGTGNFVEGATVTLFLTKDDYINNQNATSSANTDAKGKVIFKKLEPRKYYLDVRKAQQNNDGRGSETDKLKEGRVNKVNVVIE